MVGKYAAVKHVRVGDHDVPGLADGFAGGGRRVPVISIGLDRHIGFIDHLAQLADLVRRKGLRREQIQRPSVFVFQDGLEHGQVITQGLAGGRGRDDADVLALYGGLDRIVLMAVEPVDPPSRICRKQPRIQPIRKRRVLGLPRRYSMPMGDAGGKPGVRRRMFQPLLQVHLGWLLSLWLLTGGGGGESPPSGPPRVPARPCLWAVFPQLPVRVPDGVWSRDGGG